MQLIKLIAASLLIPIGLFALLTIATELINPEGSIQSKIGMATGGLILGLPALGIGGWLLWNESQHWYQKIDHRSRRLDSIFCHLLIQNQGRITVSDLVRFTHLSSQEAETFIQRKARERNASWEKMPNEEIIYYFDVQ